MRKLGFASAFVMAIVGAGVGILAMASVGDLKRYLKMRSM
jgi:hypothetical protein